MNTYEELENAAADGKLMQEISEKVNAAAKGITLENAAKTDPVPLHPGSKKAIAELG